ncbi:MucB/RseB C-terminal domain-containing protein [Thiorhodovibrio winogradskyi]|nr:MucB/RseB C-terminal domain-containing protein [Thiorhodovibrio winogradskyi]
MVEPDAELAFALLERMVGALNTTNFEGTFVYQFGDTLSAMRIVHYHNDGVSQESLLTLNGPVRTMGRSSGVVSCLLSGGQAVLLNRARQNPVHQNPGQHNPIHRSGAPGPARKPSPPDWRQLAMYYRFSLLDRTRVAGREADVVDVMPRDALRYGYRFSIDRKTALPLRTALIDGQGHPVQQLMFTDLRLLSGEESKPHAAAQAEPSPILNAQAGDDPAAASAATAPYTAIQQQSRWSFGQLPAGFSLHAHEWIESDSGAPVEYFLFSDGLASVSLYVEPGDQAGLVGQTRMATIHAAGKWVADHQITAVGEVPSTTVAALLDAIDVRPDSPQAGSQNGPQTLHPQTDSSKTDSSGLREGRPAPFASDAGDERQESP